MGIAGILLVTIFVHDVREPAEAGFDWIGFAISGVTLSCLMFGFETVGRGVFPIQISLAALGLGGVAALGFAVHATRHPAPLIDFSLLRYRTFLVSVIAGTLFRVGVGAIPFLMPMMLQLTFGRSPVQSGLITFASSAGALVMKPVSMTALRHFGFRDTLLVNGAVSAVLLGLCGAFRPAWPLAAIYLVLLAGGFLRSLQFTAYNALAYAEIPRARMSAATSLYSTIQQVSLTLGISIGAAALTVAMSLGGHATPMVADFSVGFLVVALFSFVAAPVSLLMPRDAASDLSGHRLGR